jgi:hypothetical protein
MSRQRWRMTGGIEFPSGNSNARPLPTSLPGCGAGPSIPPTLPCAQISSSPASATRALGCRFSPAVARALLGHPGPPRRAFSGKGYKPGPEEEGRTRSWHRQVRDQQPVEAGATRRNKASGPPSLEQRLGAIATERSRSVSLQRCRNQAGAGSVHAHRVQQRHVAQRLAAFRPDLAKVRARLARDPRPGCCPRGCSRPEGG